MTDWMMKIRAIEATAVTTPEVREKPSAGKKPRIAPTTAAPSTHRKKGQPSSLAAKAAK